MIKQPLSLWMKSSALMLQNPARLHIPTGSLHIFLFLRKQHSWQKKAGWWFQPFQCTNDNKNRQMAVSWLISQIVTFLSRTIPPIIAAKMVKIGENCN